MTLILIAGFIVNVGINSQQTLQNDIKLLQGCWQDVGLQFDGADINPEILSDITYKITKKEMVREHLYGAKFVLILGGDKLNKTIDFIHISGSKHLGIYKFEKGMLVICYSEVGLNRPEVFSTIDSPKFTLETMRRMK